MRLWTSAVIGLFAAALAATQPATAQDDFIPAGRAIVRQGVDFYGGDIRSIFDTSIEICRDACVGDETCKAFTYNENAGACFLKADHTDVVPFAGAQSAEILRPDALLAARAASRAADLAFIAGYLESARDYARMVGLTYPMNDFSVEDLLAGAATYRNEGSAEQAFWNTITVANFTDNPRDWLDAADLLVAAADQNPDMAADYRSQARLAAINAYLRSEEAGMQAEALNRIAQLMEALGEGSAAIPALRLSQSLQPRDIIATALERVIGLYGFHIVDNTVGSDAAQPRICVNFSENLRQKGVDYADFVRIEGEDLPVEVKDAQICIDGVRHGQTVGLTIREGLPSASGEVLQSSVDLEIYVRDRSPSVRFAGRAYVLPKSDDAAIPVIGVNATEVDLAIYRVAERNIRTIMRDGYFGAFIAGYDRDYIAGNLGEAIWSGTGQLQTELNQDITTSLPLGEAVTSFEPGVYALTATIPGADYYAQSATQWFVVTDIGLASLSGNDGLHVFARSLASALPIAGAKAELVALNNDILGSATTGPDGYARFDAGLLRGSGGNAPALLTVTGANDDFAFLDLTEAGFDLSDRGVEGRASPPPVDVYLSTERGIYRPAETVHATVLARDSAANAIENLPLTAIVLRPDGVEHSRQLLNDAGAGGRAFALALSANAQRGGWKLRIHADPEAPALATTNFLVEDFIAEKIDFDLVLAEGPVVAGAAPIIAIDADYLYGAPAANLAVEGEVTVGLAVTYPGFDGFTFGLHDESFASGFQSIGSGYATDAGGLVAVPLTIPSMPGITRPLQMTATLRLADGSGRPVERSLTRPVAPDGPRIGIKLLFDGVAEEGSSAGFEVIAIGADLTRSVSARAEWTLSRVETSYQWYELDGSWNYEPVTRRERVASGPVDLAPGAIARIEVPVAWGQYELAVTTTGSAATASSVSFSAGWYAASGSSTTPDILEIGLDKAKYAVGDTAYLRLNARYVGKVLVHVMSDRLIAMQAVDVPAGATTVPLSVTADWGPGAYVTATLIRPMDVAAGHNPARAIGLAWAPVDPGTRDLDVQITTPDAVDPRSTMTAAVKITNLQPNTEAFVTLAAVDVGILNMTGFAAPEPEEHYFGQRKLGMEIRDVYGRLIDGLSGTRGSIRSGGDGASTRTAPPPTEKLVAFFSGPVMVAPDGTAAAAFDLPDFNGTVKIMAVAWTKDGVGSAEKDVLVRDPIVVTASLPRFLAPGDTSRLLLDIAHAAGPAGEIEVALLASSGVTLAHSGRQQILLTALGRAGIEIPITAGAVGDQSISIQLTTPDGTVLTRNLTLAIRSNDPEIARQNRVPLAANGGELVIDANIFAGLAPGSARATLSIGPLARFDAPGLLTALDAYPYGCTEQITSKALPLLYFDQVAAAMGMADGDKVKLRIGQAIESVLANQSSTGAFGLWGPGEGDLWLDAYVTDFLSRARALGHTVPEKALKSALNNLGNAVNYAQDFENAGEALAYALMVLAREGDAAIGDLRYYADIKALDFATPLAKAQLGAALAYYGDQRRADAMFRLAYDATRAEEDVALYRVDYGTSYRDSAAVLALAVEAGSTAVDIQALARQVGSFGGGEWRSTQENMWTLLAAHALVEQAASGDITVNGAVPDGPLVRLFEDALLAEETFTFANNGAQPVDAVLTTFGIPTDPEPAGGNGYRIERAYFTMAGEPVDLADVSQNQRLVAMLTVTPERDVQARLMIDDPLPAGLEIENPNLLSSGAIAGLEWLTADDVATHSEFRSDRFLAAVDWSGTAPFSLAYIVRAISPGSFHQPAASVEDMYRPAYRARTAAGRLVVGPAG